MWRLVRARREAVPDSVRRFSERVRQRRLRAALPWLIGLAAAAVLAGAATILLVTPLFGVSDVRVVGARLVTAAEVRAAAHVPPGTPLARVDAAAVSRRVARLAPVATATVTRHWPRTLVVRVVERTAVAVVPAGRRYAVVDRTGTVFERVAHRPATLPVLKVAHPGLDDPATVAALTVLGALPEELRSELASASADGPARVTLNLRDGRRVVWGDATQNDVKARVVLAMLNRDQPVIDVTSPLVVPGN